MKLTFSRATMKKGLEACKSIDGSRKPKKHKVWLFTVGENNIFLYASRDDGDLKYFFHLHSTEAITEKISFLADTNELIKLFEGKSKEKELSFELDLGGEVEKVSIDDKEAAIQLFDGTSPIPKLEYQKIDEEEFFDKIKLATTSMGSNIESIGFGGREISVRSPIYLKRINLDEDISSHTFPAEHIRLFSSQVKKNWRKSDNKSIHIHDNQNILYIRFSAEAKKESESFRQLFVLRDKNESVRPVRLESETVHSFKVNAEDMLHNLSSYTAEVPDVYLYDKDGKMVIDPYDPTGGEEVEVKLVENEDEEGLDSEEEVETEEEVEKEKIQPVYEMEYEGNIKRSKISVEALRALLTGYEGDINIDIDEYLEHDEKCYIFKIYSPLIYSLCVIKKEPNYLKVQKKLDEIIESQKKLKYIN